MIEELKKRIDGLHAELEVAVKREETVAAFDHWLGLILMGVALFCSGAAVIGGLAEWLTTKGTGALALVPGALAVVAATIKFEAKANWHYRKRDGLKALSHALAYQLPAEPSAGDIAAVVASWTSLTEEMQKEWERDFSLDWARVLHKATGTAPGDTRHARSAQGNDHTVVNPESEATAGTPPQPPTEGAR